MGRTKQPKEIAELSGSASKNPQRFRGRGSSKSTVKVHANKPQFRNEETSNAWDAIVPALETQKILAIQDLPFLGEMFDCLDELVDSKKQLRKFESQFEDLNEISNNKELLSNQKRLRESVNMYRGTWIKFASRFGISPTERGNLSLPEDGETDPLAVVLGD